MDAQVATALAQQNIDNPISRTSCVRRVRLAYQDDPTTAVGPGFSADRILSPHHPHADDPPADDVTATRHSPPQPQVRILFAIQYWNHRCYQKLYYLLLKM